MPTDKQLSFSPVTVNITKNYDLKATVAVAGPSVRQFGLYHWLRSKGSTANYGQNLGRFGAKEAAPVGNNIIKECRLADCDSMLHTQAKRVM